MIAGNIVPDRLILPQVGSKSQATLLLNGKKVNYTENPRIEKLPLSGYTLLDPVHERVGLQHGGVEVVHFQYPCKTYLSAASLYMVLGLCMVLGSSLAGPEMVLEWSLDNV